MMFIPGTLFFLLLLFMLFSNMLLVARVREHSMEPVLDAGQLILIRRGEGNVRRGEILVFPSPESQKLIVKRCMLTEGDPIIIDGYWLKTDRGSYYLSRDQQRFLSSYGSVPEGSLLLLGDNQFHSHDSRDFGFIAEKHILGKVILLP